MKNVYVQIISLMFLITAFISCNSEPSLQEYYVEKQNSSEFISLDLPASLLSLNESSSNETKEAMESLKKLNILAYKIDDSNKDMYLIEYKKVKEIINNDKYNELVRMNHDGVHVIIKYLGDDNAIDEIIVLASDKSKGFALARVLGDKMNPEKIIKLAQNFKDIDKDNSAFSQISELFGEFN